MDTGTFDLPNDIFDPDLAYLNDDIIDSKVELENVAKQVDASVTLDQNTALTKVVKKAKPSTSSQPVLGNLKVQVRKRSSGELLSLLSGEQSPEDKPGTSSSADTASNLMPAPEEPCYFPEKWPGKVCILCNLGERSQLGQGEMLRMEAVEEEAGNGNLSTLSTEEKSDALSQEAEKAANALTAGILASNKRQKGVNKCKVPAANAEYIDELERIGHTELSEFSAFVDSGHYYVHRSCAIWSFGVQREANGALTNVLAVVNQALKAKCSYCSRYGASLVCKMSCSKNFHFPCVAAAGGFQVIQSFTSFCKEHLGQVPLVCTDDINCRVCSGLGDVGNLMMCSRCGDHYHGSCKGIAQLPGARAGWQCDSCRMCQICRVPDSAEGRLLSCELCDKVYHVNCIRPVMTSVPKYGWKCRCCRVCTDCGARTPGAGASSRWHNHYTVCDSCYQQRNKGYSCPVCNRAYRAAAYREMVKCSVCQKFVHATCDPDAELTTYQAKKETNPDYEYVCGPCNKLVHTGRVAAAMRRNSTIDDESVGSQENVDMDMEIEEIKMSASDIGLGKGKPTSLVASKIAKKRLGLHHGAGITKAKVVAGKLPYLKKQRFGDFGRKKCMKSKTATGVFGTAGVSLQKPLADINKSSNEDDANDNRLVLCSAKDKFVLTQDVCVMCGAIGTDHEGCLISCAQCGQCYHPYCINIKITKVILEKGWRCLDCTVCEGCGQKNDEARLILCDDCDVSYHTYCMDPPLDFVPHGNWKCKWCASCQKCGGNVPGFNCTWMNSYTECGPCASQTSCCICEEGYADGELIIQCTQCDRWLHCLCDTIKNETEADKCSEEGYSCPLCRPAGVPPPHLRPKKKVPEKSSKTPTSKTPDGDKDYPLSLEGTHFLDGVCLNDHGLNQIKYLQAELSKQRPKRKPKTADLPPPLPKDDGILAAIESVVASTSLDNSMEDVKVDLLDPKEEAEIYKDGMPWTTTDPPPEGFSVFTTEQGTVVLRKKRQRNLQKLGIGGFAVRNRNFRQKDEGEDFESMAQTMDQANTCDVVDTPTTLNPPDLNKNKKKQQRKKNKSKLIETYPNYLQEAFFGKSLLDPLPQVKFEIQSSDDELKTEVSDDKTIKLNADELKLIEAVKCKNEQENSDKIEKSLENKTLSRVQEIKKEEIALDDDENNSDTEALKEMLGLPNDLVDNDLITSIMNEDELSKASAGLDDVTPKDELAEMLTDPHFNLDSLGTMDGKDVEEIFKGVLTDESQESQESIFANSVNSGMTYSRTSTPQHVANIQSPNVLQSPSRLVPQQQQPLLQTQQNIIQNQPNQMIAQQLHTTAIPQQQQIRTMPGGQQYHVNQGQISQLQPGMVQQQTMQMQGPQGVPHQQQQQNIPIVGQAHQMNRGNQYSPLYGPNGEQLQTAQNMQPVQGNPQQWQQNVNIPNQQMSNAMVPGMDVNMVTGQVVGGEDMGMSSAPLSYNQKNSERMRLDEALNNDATISCVLYANTNHPELRNEYPIWADRFKQILKKWRTLSNEQKQPYLTKARENRSAIRMKKAQQVQPQSSPKESSSSNPSPATTPQTIIPNTSTDQLDQGQTIIVQHTGPNAQQIHLVGAQQQTQQLTTVQQQPNVVLPAASPIQQSPVSQQQLIEVPGNSTTCTTNLVDANNGNNPTSIVAPSNTNRDIPNASVQNSTLSPQLHLTESQNLIKISASQTLDNTNKLNSNSSETNPSSSNNNFVQSSDTVSNSNSNNETNQKGPNITVAANIANTFINISSNQSTGKNPNVNQNVNVIAVSQQPLQTQHFMKTLTINTSRGNIFVPNVIATNLAGTPQFTVHHHQYGLHPNSSGPAPNVTVNPNGNFATSSNAMIRPHAYQATQFRPFLASTASQSNPNVVQSPILAASLQTINKIATNQSKSIGKVTIIQTQTTQNTIENSQNDESERKTPNTPTRALTPQTSAVVDQQIRVLTPSEIMRTLPSLSTQDTTLLQQQTIINTNSQISSQNVNNSSSNVTNVKSQANITTVANHSTISNVVCSSTTTTSIVTTCSSSSSPVTTVTTQNAQTINDKQITDQEKINAQQKSQREAEQENKWKQMQAHRAREQQMQQQLSFNPDPNGQPQLQQPNIDINMSPNSRQQFVTPINKVHPGMTPQSPGGANFQHPGLQRQMSQPNMMPRQMNPAQQRPINQSPFSPQTPGTPQSPHDLFPNPPVQTGVDQFQRPEGSQDVFQSPQPQRVGQDSPNQTANRSPAYQMASQSSQPQPGYAPGTPRPNFSTNTVRPTVYARPGELFIPGGNNTPPFQSPRAETFQQPSPQEGNRQLRDLLQRQQAPTQNQQSPNPAQSPTQMFDNQNNLQSPVNSQSAADNFRQPLPPGMIQRPTRMPTTMMSGGTIIRNQLMQGGQIVQGPRAVVMTGDVRQKFLRQGNVITQQQVIMQGGQQFIIGPQGQRMPVMQQQTMQQTSTGDQNILLQQRLQQRQVLVGQQNMQQMQANQQITHQSNIQGTADQTAGQSSGEQQEIPDIVTAEIEKLEREQEETGEVEGVGEFLTKLGDDDDELLVSLTTDMGDDFNLLEYADPELEGDGEKSNFLDSLDLDEPILDVAMDKTEEKKVSEQPKVVPKQTIPQQSQQPTTNIQMNQQIQMQGNMQQNIIQQQQQVQQTQHVIVNTQQAPGQTTIHRFKTLPQGQITQQMLPANFQQIQQQMLHQIQQAAAMGKPMAPGTQLQMDGVIGIVTANNGVQISLPNMINRQGIIQNRQGIQHIRMQGQNILGQQGPRMMHIQGTRIIQQTQLPQQTTTVVQNQQNTLVQQLQQPSNGQSAAPPPPYPEPPPPYPGANAQGNQEQPLLLEELVEQEKREQAQGQPGQSMINQSLVNNPEYEKIHADLVGSTSQMLQNNQQIMAQPGVQRAVNNPGIRAQFMPRGVQNIQQGNWRPQMPQAPSGQPPMSSPTISTMQQPPPPSTGGTIQQTVPLYQANFQPAPPVPPENIQSDADERTQKLYEQWLESHNIALTNQLNYYETEVQKLRKARKTLNSKQRQLKKTGADLSDEDQRELAKVLQEQGIIQKQLEQSRKQMKQHTSTKQEYENKKMAKLQPQVQLGQSPAHMENQSPLIHPGQSPMNPQMMHQPVPSPLQSPSPLMTSQSPGPSILQSPSNHNSQSAMSPYNTMSQSPRIGTPHTPIDDNPFSPNNLVAGPSPSPSLQGRLTSPAPRMTSPQHRMAAPVMAGGRLITASPGQQFQGQQNIVAQNQFQNQMQQPGVQMQGQMRFVRPQMMSNDPNLRMRMPANFQQGQIQQIRQVQQGYTSPIGSPQSTQMQIQQQQQSGMSDGMIMQNNRGMQQMVQQRQMMQQRQMQQQMQAQNNQNMQVMNPQMMSQQQNQQTIVQMQQNQYARQSPIHQQPPSPLLSQNNPNSPMTPRSPMVNYGQQQQQQQQNPTSPMMMGNSPLMRRPPSTGLPERPQSVESSPRMNQYGMDQSGGGGGGNIPGNPIPCLPPGDFFYRKPGLRGGTPMWGAGRGKRPPGPQNTRQANAKTTMAKNKPILIVNASSSVEQGQSSSAADKRTKLQKQESVVIVDSSPERMMDYDDDNDKSLVAAEVSLSSVAQHIGENDEIHIEQYNSGFDNIASSPLDGTEANDEYVLFNSDVVNYDDESLRTKETNMAEEETHGEIRIIETPNVEMSSEVVRLSSAKVTATTEDFEAMIDHGSKDGEGIDNKSASTSTKQDPAVITISQAKVPTTQIKAQQIQQKQTTYSRTIIPGNLLSGATIVTSSAAAVAAHKKDGTQTTAKVSIGNKTIHVPVLKSGFLQQGAQQQGKQIQMKKIGPQSSINLIKNPTIIQVGNRSIKNPNIVTLSSLNLTTPINPAILTKAFIRPMNANIQKVDVVTAGEKSKTQITQIQQHATQSTATVNEKFIQIQTKPSSSQATMSFTKLSSLMMTQDASLPTKIFEDESVSPDNSATEVVEDANSSITVTKKVVEQKQFTSKSDEKGDNDELMDMMASITGESKLSPPSNVQQVKSDAVNTDDLVSTLSDNSQDSKDGIKVVQASPNEGKKQGVIPVHVIIKSRESSSSPILQGNVGQRLVSVVPQLSPLSQPNELTQNVTNVSQQLRNIMSSINPGTTISQNTNQTTKKDDSETKPETTIQKQIIKTDQQQQGTILATHLQQISSQPPISAPLTSQQGNIVVVKHIRNPNAQDGQGNNGQTIVVMSQPQMLPGNNSVIITQGALNKQQTSILSNQLQGVTQQGVTRIINYSENQSQPPALVVTGRQGVAGQQIAVASSSGGSILSATLSQPPVSKTVNVSNATITNLLQTQLTSPSFRRSKSTDEVPAFMKDNIPGHITGIKRHSIEASSIKPEPMDTDENNVSSTTTSVTLTNKPNEAASSNSITIVTNRITSMPAPQVKQDNESQNVLLKQLLQNSGSSVSVTPTTTTLTNRPLSTVLTSQSRAPSLGFASSLEDQLSRPVIPPNLNQPVSISSSSASLINTHSINKTTITTQASTDALKSNIVTSKLVTRETSFVSKPVTTTATPSIATQSFVTPLHNSHNQSSVSEIRKIIGSTFANKDEGSSFLSSSILQTSKLTETSRESPPVSKTSEITETSQNLPPTTQQEQMPRIDGSISSGPPPNVVIKKEDMVPTNILQSSLAAQQQRTTTIENPNTPAAISAILSQSLNQQQQQQQQSTLQPASQVTTTMTPVTVQSTTIMKVDPNSAVVTTNQPQAPEMIIKQEIKIEKDIEGPQDSLAGSITSTMEIKKEIIGMPQMPTTTSGFMTQSTPTAEKTREEIEAEIKERELAALELKKKKRREYQKNRRQQQLLKNEQLKTMKKTKKPSKYEEDYDTFIDNLITQIRQLPPMQVLEPLLPRNYNVCAMHGTGDLSKFSTQKSYSFINGDLVGEFGKAELPSLGDYFNIKPFGYKDPVPKAIPVSTQWGFYDAEFPIIRFDEVDDRRRYDFGHKDRDNDTPDSIISSSSPECVRYDPPIMYPGLRLIKEEESEDEELVISKRMSPTVPIVAPVPIRLKPGSVINVEKMHESGSNNKENEGTKDIVSLKSRLGATTPLKDSSNLTVTLTLTSSAAEDIMGVLRDLANILHIPPPNSYQIVERTQTPPSQKLGLYRIKGKDGKEGEPIDIQTILNGNAKFCRHCDVVILNQVVRAKSSDFPLLVNNTDKLEFESEDLYFCSRSCYKQFQWRPTNITEDKQLDSNGNTKLGVFDFEDDSMKMEVDADESSKTSISSLDSKSEKSRKLIDDCDLPPAKAAKLVRWRNYSSSVFPSPPKIKRETEREIVQNLFRMNITVTAGPKTDDTRKCIFCHQIGDGVADGPSRLLNFDVDKWVHLNCALWSDGVYETENGALMNLETALQQSLTTTCYICNQLGATIKCFKNRCASVYHLNCALKDNCVFYKNKSMMCQVHATKSERDQELTTLSVQRRVYVERDECRQVASVMHHSELSNLMRVGSLIFLNVGQILPHQLQAFHTTNFIYPIGYKMIRFYWSMRHPNKRCRYVCSIADVCGRPEFRVLVQEQNEEDIELRDNSPKAVWQRILEPIAELRKDNRLIQLFPKFMTGEDLFGLTEPSVVRILESLPGIETLTDYRFKYGRNPLLELPLAINPSGAARTEPKLKQSVTWKKPHTQRTGSTSQRPTFVSTNTVAGEVACPYSKQFVHSKSSQYKKMKQEWRNNVFLARSKIQGLGLYAARDLEKHTMVIEYIGEIIRSELSERREKQYEDKNRGIYMFRLDEERVVDATLSGGLARYINHSCNPNCVTEIVEVDREVRIIIFAKRRINRGEELSYDYKFDIEDDAHKIQCMCGAPNCRKWMN